MNEFAKMDTFFIITTAAVIVLTLVLVIAAAYVIKILNDIKYISRVAKTESDQLATDIQELRRQAHAEGMKLKTLAKFFGSFIKRHKK